MPQHLEPTYLRYIYDGLVKGDLHPENAAELPDGLIGLYDEVFDERRPVLERQKLLQRFAIWALLKKEVSVAFVAEVLDEPEHEIQDFIATYSSWFNSPESGKYQLYHERLKVYLLQKLSEGEVSALHEKLIARLERAIEEQKADEFERYGLEFITTHLINHSILNGSKLNPDEYKNNCDRLSMFCVDKDHLRRQIELSNGILWSRDSIFFTITFFQHIQVTIPSDFYESLIDLHKDEEYRIIRSLSLVSPEKSIDVFNAFKHSLDNGAIDFQIAVIFYYLIIKDVLDAVFEEKGRLLEFFTNEFKNYLFSNKKNVFEVLPSYGFLSILIECNKYIENCFEDFLLSDYCFIDQDFVEQIRKNEINVKNLHNHIRIFDSLISHFKKNDDDFLAKDILDLKIYTLLNFDKSIEAMDCIDFEKKQGYFDSEDILEVERTITAFKSNYPSSNTLTLGFEFELSDFERFNFYTWIINVIDELEKNDLVKAKNLMNQIDFDFEEINALIEFLRYRNQTKHLKYIIGNSRCLIDHKWDTSWCARIFESQNESGSHESPYRSNREIEDNHEHDFTEELFFCTKIDLDEIQRGKLLSKLLNDSYKYSKHVRAIANLVISVIYFNDGENLKSDDYFARTLNYCSENTRTLQINKFIVFNLTKRQHFELSFQYLKDLNDDDKAVQSQVLILEIMKVLGYAQALNWSYRLLEITENKLLVEEIMTILNLYGKQKDALDIINSLSKSENKFYANLRLCELNEGNTFYRNEINSAVQKNYDCTNIEVLVRLTKLDLLDLVKYIIDKYHGNNSLKMDTLYELAGKLLGEKNFIFLATKFKENQEYIESLTFGYLSKIKYPNINLSILSNIILINKKSFEICFKLQIVYFIVKFFNDTLDLKEFTGLSKKYNLQWAIDIKNQLPN
jgi:hypothetical protein